MSNHKITMVPSGDGWSAVCSCRHSSGYRAHHWQADEWRLEHEAIISRVRSYLGPKNPSLKTQRDYFLDQAENDTNLSHRALWRQLADEITQRLNESGTDPDEQTALF